MSHAYASLDTLSFLPNHEATNNAHSHAVNYRLHSTSTLAFPFTPRMCLSIWWPKINELTQASKTSLGTVWLRLLHPNYLYRGGAEDTAQMQPKREWKYLFLWPYCVLSSVIADLLVNFMVDSMTYTLYWTWCRLPLQPWYMRAMVEERYQHAVAGHCWNCPIGRFSIGRPVFVSSIIRTR